MEFDFQAPSEIDTQALRRLFQQQWYTHAPQLNLSVLADHVVNLAQTSGIGTVVKVDDLEQIHDPYAVMSCVTLDAKTEAAKLVQDYFKSQLSRAASAKPLLDLMLSSSESRPILFILHERMINLPPQIMPPLLRMLLAEVEETLAETSAPAPTHALFFSRAFSADALDEGRGDSNEADDTGNDEEPSGLAGARKRKASGKHAHPVDAANAALGRQVHNKKRPGVTNEHDDGLGSFHPEDEFIREAATHSYTFRFPAPRDASETFEPPLYGRILAVPYTKMPAVLERLLEIWPAPA